jgi:probable rRNA maturation factor
MIEIINFTITEIDEEFLKKVAEKVLESEKQKNKDLSLVLVGQGRIRKLNKKYRGKNRVTDVLSFPNDGLGEVVICLREVKKNAKRFNQSFERELIRVLIHGILHLLGYDHEGSKQATEKMVEKEEYYLSQTYD